MPSEWAMTRIRKERIELAGCMSNYNLALLLDSVVAEERENILEICNEEICVDEVIRRIREGGGR
jgi:hypothetical protein